jgi:hypothetical protein
MALRAGKPPVKVEELEPLRPDRAGVSMGFMNTLRLIFLVLPRIHLLYAIRPSVGIERAANVRSILSFQGFWCVMGRVARAVYQKIERREWI